ncbi:efflux pump antibiotic resistance protein [Aspergillus steynii IBT 23096]|uniref:Efflux pump antibiotic resistance protein n=1 Tax=Aspergillus steynii IBT 23096 TaxID=1392250 RepID=A0A2I2GEV3_9EURO|nr:efflux pump antibiotic resistance protein [Aspergillus steynii IBT 23096]PLB51402.1 efflux pump antibiotic resistance protein [Aspergillus steynii IBT 23096]
MVADVDETSPLNPSAPENRNGGASYQSIAKATGQPSGDVAGDEESATASPPAVDQGSIRTIVAVLLVGEFISNADSTLVMATTGKISSEFNRLQDASWLSTAYTLGVCAAQPMYGKLSDIYGRRPLLLAAYALFATGCLASGMGRDLWTVIVGRAVSGIGGAGIMTLGSIIITDTVPRREVASWRAYINIFMTLGRSLGGPVGGWLTDAVGWRWLFLLQPPFIVLAAGLVLAKLKLSDRKSSKGSIRRVDFLGTALLAISIVAVIVLLDRGGHAFPWASWTTMVLGSAGLSALATFVWVEMRVASEPIFHLDILRRPNVASSYLIGFLQIASQLGMLFSVPLYFQVTQRASATVAGGHMVPAVVGNTFGGLLAGAFIRRTGRYKTLLVVAGLVASISHVLLLVRWNGATGAWESLYITPGGLGTGIASAAAFVSMTALLQPQEVAMATSGYMLLVSLAMTTGVTMTNTVLGHGFKSQLQHHLRGDGAAEIIRRATSDTDFIARLDGKARDIVVGCFVTGLKNTYVISLVFSIVGSLVGLSVRQHRL